MEIEPADVVHYYGSCGSYEVSPGEVVAPGGARVAAGQRGEAARGRVISVQGTLKDMWYTSIAHVYTNYSIAFKLVTALTAELSALS